MGEIPMSVKKFKQSMNEHPTARYRSYGDYVTELERPGERWFLRVWESPDGDPSEDTWELKFYRKDDGALGIFVNINSPGDVERLLRESESDDHPLL